MPTHQKVVTVVGGSGFLGRYVVHELARAGYTVRVICRHPDSALFLKPAAHIGSIVIEKGDITRFETIESKLKGSYAVVNLVGLLFERGRQKFATVHAQGAEKLAKAAKDHGAERFIHISALGVNKSQNAKYARTKASGEKAVLAAFPGATILRPSVLFGPEDDFFNKFASMARFSPFLPLIGGGNSKFQPVYVNDVARAIRICTERDDTEGKIYELGGPRVMSLRAIMQYILETTGMKRRLLPIPSGIATIIGKFGQFLPKPPLTADQVRLLKYHNVVDREALTFADLGINPTGVEVIVPEYLHRYHRRTEEALGDS